MNAGIVTNVSSTVRPCAACGSEEYAILIPELTYKGRPLVICALDLASIVDTAMGFNWRRNLMASFASRRIGEELGPRARTQKRAR